MISNALVACRPTSVSAAMLYLLACLAAALALGATPALAAVVCPNEQLRKESSVNPATGQPYSTGLPDCRAYEMVSPLYKQSRDATAISPSGGVPVAPDGNTAGFGSEGDFSNPQNYVINAKVINPFLSQRGASGWITSMAAPPVNLVDLVALNGLEGGDTSPDLRSVRVGCGTSSVGKGEVQSGGGHYWVCAVHKLGGEWEPATPKYPDVGGRTFGSSSTTSYLGASSDLSRIIINPGAPLLLYDTLGLGGFAAAGIYEISAVGSASPVLRLVNLDNEGNELTRTGPNKETRSPLFGDRGISAVRGSEYHAFSESGEAVFFTATPPTPKGGVLQTLYARLPCVTGVHCAYVEKVDRDGRVEKEGPTNLRGEPTGRETAVVSAQAPSPECIEACASSPPANATFQAASADGSKVFFTTTQKLLNGDANTEYDLYEYDVATKKLTLISGGKPGTSVAGVVRSSPDGSHVYFVENGVLEKADNKNTWRDAKGEEKNEEALPGANLYGYDTVTRETKFVAHTGFEQPTESQTGEQEERLGNEISVDTFRPGTRCPRTR